MSLSERDRKLLWGRAANRCAMCKGELVIHATATDRESIIGDEAHIIADSLVCPEFYGVGVPGFWGLTSGGSSGATGLPAGVPSESA